MAEWNLKAYAKINIGLDVIRRLENGYHEVNMIMQTISLHDTLCLEKQERQGISMFTNKRELPGDENNLAYKAADLLMKEFHIQMGLKITLDKQIPIAAGMAGGSSDAAAVFRGVNEMFELGLSVEELQKRAVTLGADIPYCIVGGTMLSQGIGEKLSKAPAMPDCFILAAKPSVGVSTKWVYENLHVQELKEHPDIDGMLVAMAQRNLSALTDKMENVLERVTIQKHPVIGQIKRKMEESGALRAMMSGSGPSVFGIFESREQMQEAYEAMKESGLALEIFQTMPVNI